VGPSPAKPADLEEEKLSLRDKLKALEELQKVDLETNELRAEAESIPRRRAEIETAVGEARGAYDAEKARLQENEKERRQLESLLGMERDKVKKWEGRLGEIRTPREYAALSREIDIAKKSNDTQQEQIKTLAAAAGEIQKGLDAREEALAEREEDAHAQLEALRKKGAEFEERLVALEKKRAETAKKVDPGLLGKYEQIRRRRAGIAVAPVEGSTCKGCNRNIPPQLSIVLQRANSIETCPNCHRIIYVAEAVNPAAPSVA
jgi:predicted  nucleic acid-binding Zn-ribbon protein